MGIVLDSTQRFVSHPTEEILEEYARNHLPEALVAQVEEHLLICPSCQDAVSEIDRFVSAFQAATKQPDPAVHRIPAAWLSGPAVSRLGIAAAVILALTVVWKHPQAASTPVTVSLSSLRGSNALSPAPAGKPLQLNIDAPDVAPGNDYRVEVVDATGNPVWTGTVSGTSGKLYAPMPKSLSRGVYWVRLYSADSELLREFGMTVK